MSASERRKGAGGELELARIIRLAGWPDAKRTSDGRAQIDRGDIGDGPEGVYWEARRRERFSLWASLADAEAGARAGDTPVVAFRRNRSRWYAALPLDDLLDLLADCEDQEREDATRS